MSVRIVRQLAARWLRSEPFGSYAGAVGGMSAVRLTGGLLLFLSQVLLARWMGREAFGTYSFAWAWMAVLAPIAGLGLGGAAVRYLATYRVRNDQARTRGLLRFGRTAAVSSACVIALLGLLLAPVVAGDSPFLASLQVAFLAIPAMAVLALEAGYARGFNWMVMSVLGEQVGRPLALIVLGALWVAIHGAESAPTWVAICVAAYAVAATAQHGILRRRIDREIGPGPVEFDVRPWLRVSAAVLVLTAAQMMRANTDLILVGALLGPADVGMYTAAVRVATLVAFVLAISSVAAQPRMAAMHAQGQREELRRFVRSATRSIFVVSLAIGGSLALLGRWVLGLFGHEFTSAYPALLVLILGHVLAAASGPLTSLLTMTGRHTRAAALHGAFTVTNALLIAWLVPRFGIVGAAVATSLNLALTQVALVLATRQQLRSPAGRTDYGS